MPDDPALVRQWRLLKILSGNRYEAAAPKLPSESGARSAAICRRILSSAFPRLSHRLRSNRFPRSALGNQPQPRQGTRLPRPPLSGRPLIWSARPTIAGCSLSGLGGRILEPTNTKTNAKLY